jgi:hypothetical protein
MGCRARETWRSPMLDDALLVAGPFQGPSAFSVLLQCLSISTRTSARQGTNAAAGFACCSRQLKAQSKSGCLLLGVYQRLAHDCGPKSICKRGA